MAEDFKKAEEKLQKLKAGLASYGSALVAYSGGVDSAFLLKVSYDVLGSKAVALTAKSPSLPEKELTEAVTLAKSIGVQHLIVNSNELTDPNYSSNPENRCYYCKTELYSICTNKIKELGINTIVDGFNKDDEGDYRPGRVAAKEHKVLSPLADAGLTKEDIRWLSKDMGLPTWNKPNMACLSSRFPYGTEITKSNLKKVELAEDYLKEMGFNQLRVRYFGDKASIELGKNEIPLYSNEIGQKVKSRFLEIGFDEVLLDPEGYRTGKLNDAITSSNKTG